MATATILNSKQIYLAKLNNSRVIGDLFIYTSLVCNKSCHHCFVSSTPTNHTLDDMTSYDLNPIWEELPKYAPENIYFTGGEPFLNKDIINMINEALNHAQVTIYTNATRPLEKRLKELQKLNQDHIDRHQKPILLRVSLDHINASIHDVYYGRGKGAWQESLQISTQASELGLDISITTQSDIHDQAPDSWVERSFIKLYQEHNIELQDVKVLPDIPTGKHDPNPNSSSVQKPAMSLSEFDYSGTPQTGLMCHTGRTLIKLKGQLQVYPCTLIIPDRNEAISILEEYTMGKTLTESVEKGQLLDHPACRAYCIAGKQSCAN